MSRIGIKPVVVPSGVKAAIDGILVKLEGPKGKLSFKLGEGVSAKLDSGALKFARTSDTKQARANFGTARATVNTMVTGVHTGWKKNLELVGVGYRAEVKGKNLVLSLGYSSPVSVVLPSEVKCSVDKNTVIILESCDKQLLGNFAAKVRSLREPEPYLGKGVRYSDEVVRRKAGKTGKK